MLILKRVGYSEANGRLFSQQQAALQGWRRYGDPEYVSHVLRYYSGGSLFAGLFGNSQMASVAMSQFGNEGGEKFWLWYGFSSREEWCACVLVRGSVRADCQWNSAEIFAVLRRNELIPEQWEAAGE